MKRRSVPPHGPCGSGRTLLSLFTSITEDQTAVIPGFDLPRCEWSLLNHFCSLINGAPLHNCGVTQTMANIINSCPVYKSEDDLPALHTACESAREWLHQVNCIHQIKYVSHTHQQINTNVTYLGGRVYEATESSGGRGSWLRIGDRLISCNFINIQPNTNRQIFPHKQNS